MKTYIVIGYEAVNGFGRNLGVYRGRTSAFDFALKFKITPEMEMEGVMVEVWEDTKKIHEFDSSALCLYAFKEAELAVKEAQDLKGHSVFDDLQEIAISKTRRWMDYIQAHEEIQTLDDASAALWG